MDTLNTHLPTIVALVFGVTVHIAKKAMTRKQANESFSLKDYLIGHPYQTFLMFAGAGAAYLGLLETSTLTLSSAFLAGVATNSLADIGPGKR